MDTSFCWTARATWLAILLVLPCCKSKVVVEDEPKKLLSAQVAHELERLFAPMQKKGAVGCDVLRVRTHRALWDRFTYPVRSRLCTVLFEKGIEGGGSRYTFRNVGSVDTPLKFIIGQRVFLVLRSASLEVSSGAPRFELEAEGSVVAQAAGKRAREASSLRVEQGAWLER